MKSRSSKKVRSVSSSPISFSSLTEEIHPLSSRLSSLSTSQLVETFVHEERCVEKAIESQAKSIGKACDLVLESLQKRGRLIYVGAGTSGRLGVLDASEIPPTFGFPADRVVGIIAGGPQAVFKSQEGAEDQIQGAVKELKKLKISAKDVICGIAASGRTPFVLGALKFARSKGAKTIVVTCNPLRNRSVKVDVSIDLPTGPEIIAGSTRLKAGTATKLVLNMLTSIPMIHLGRVEGGRMTHLQATNEKLKDRAIRNVMILRKVNREKAKKALVRSFWNVSQALESLRI